MVMPFRIGFPPNGGPPPPQMPSYVQFRPNFRQRPPMRQPPPNACLLPEENLLFVGNIDERVPNDLLHAILDCCGPLEKWQRLVGPDGRLPAFGFVGYKTAESAILCLKAMHNFRIGNKALNVRPDEKVRQTLFDHVRRERAIRNLPRKQIGTELEIEEEDTEIIAHIHEKATEIIRDTHAHLLVMEDEKTTEDRASLDRRSRTPRSERKKRKKESRSRRSESRDRKRSKRHRSSSATSTRSSRNSESDAESEDSDVILEKKMRKREQKRREEEYLRQLKKFEERERRRAKLYSHEDEEDMILQKTTQKEAKKLAQFLEDYNDERDDPKYYRSSSFYKRKQEYDRERELDRLDREEEAKELALMKENMHKDEKEEENGDKLEKKEIKPKPEEEEDSFRYSFVEDKKTVKVETPEPSTSQNGEKKVVTSFQQKVISQTISVFGEDDPDEENTHVIKKKIKKFEITHQERMESLTSEERRQMAKDLINDIPTTKEELFAYPLDWEMVDQPLVDEKIKPWVDKKIREYIGEDEPTLVRFICEKVAEHGEPQRLLGDLAMILDEEAEAFVFKLWRLIIFQSKAKRIGLNVNNRS
ncbi:unnamed protein product [Bursaphelenchus xylophilus]|uniref:(pine wood nematode) hypothetical protein n=1 Tax=Bursaphelenchus xylophilus TaxID=6326 RepID=A0A1I7SBE7_BURXY|nr:unnamed protein product [Bursaphelenchus xylophilus]CAG9122049.1 unnamed protein product [Bursaphelenchus xylophilus]